MNDNEDEIAALEALSSQMGRGRIMDALPAEEQEAIRIIITPGGGVSIEGGGGGGDTESAEDAAMQAEEIATGAEAMPPATSTRRNVGAVQNAGMKQSPEDVEKYDEDPDDLTVMTRR